MTQLMYDLNFQSRHNLLLIGLVSLSRCPHRIDIDGRHHISSLVRKKHKNVLKCDGIMNFSIALLVLLLLQFLGDDGKGGNKTKTCAYYYSLDIFRLLIKVEFSIFETVTCEMAVNQCGALLEARLYSLP